MDSLATIVDTRVVVIYRGMTGDACVAASLALYRVGLRAFEVTFNSDGPAAAIAALRAALPADATVGAGTVLTPGQVADAAAAGAQFVISPNVDAEVIAATRSAGLVSIPGAQTVTEIVQARRYGGQLIKVFPVGALGVDYIRQVRGPLSDVPLLASGGLDATLSGECLRAGCLAVGVGLPLFGVDTAAPPDPDGIERAGRRYLAELGPAC